MLDIQNLDLHLSGKPILHDITAQIQPGLCAVIGPNGSGKTSLLRAIAGLIKPEPGGRITFEGKDISQFSRKERAKTSSYLAQNASIAWPILVENLVEMGRSAWDEAQSVTLQKTRSALRHCNAEQFIGRRIDQLSGGERARVLLARALCVEAPLLLADEPTASLDPAQQIAILKVLQQQGSAGTTILWNSHDLTQAARFADQILLLDQGKITRIGTPEKVLPSNEVAQAFGLAFDAHGHMLGV